MSAVPLRRPKADDEALALLREISDLLKTLVGDQRKRADASALVGALRELFVAGVSRFTAQGVLELAAEAPHGELANALAGAIDMDREPRGRTVALGMLLARSPAVEVVGRGRGVALFRLRGLDEKPNEPNA